MKIWSSTKKEQPVIDSERQLSGKVVDEEVIGALQRTGYMTRQHMTGTTVEKEYKRRIAAINAVIVVFLVCVLGITL